MAKITTPIPQDKIGENFVWRDWFQKLSDKVFGTIASQDANNVNITGGIINNLTSPLPITSGGTNSSATPTAGAVVYGTGTTYAFTPAGSVGKVLTSGGATIPTWTTPTTGTLTSVSGIGSVNGITLTGTVTTSGSLTLGGTLSGVSLTTQISGTLPIANGGTGTTSTTFVTLTTNVTGILPVANGGNGLGVGYTVATLPTAGTTGRRSWVTDALAPAFGSIVVGSGTVVIPVFDNGTNWIVG
jgi:hypothetical protein